MSDPLSGLYGLAADEVTVENGRLTSAQREGSDTYADTLHRHQTTSIDGFGQWDPASGVGASAGQLEHVMRGNTSLWSFGAWFVVITVDPDFGWYESCV